MKVVMPVSYITIMVYISLQTKKKTGKRPKAQDILRCTIELPVWCHTLKNQVTQFVVVDKGD